MKQLNVSDIQYFSVGDGDGIRTTLFLKGCNLRCPWCHNPETVSPAPQTLVYAENGRTVSYGRLYTPAELLPLLTRDADFFRESDGGVTVSGGEPLLQSSSLVPLLSELKNLGIHVIIDTAGSLPWIHFEDVADLVDLFFFDWKSPLPQVYSDLGGSLRSVEENLGRLLSEGRGVRVRIPVIPGVNDSECDARLSCERLSEIGVREVDLLPFHRLAVGKYQALELDYPFSEVTPPTRSFMTNLAEIYKKHFSVRIEK